MTVLLRFTREEYEKARAALDAGLTQLEPDGRNCAICGDGDHQAFECNQNPLLWEKALDVLSGVLNDVHDAVHRAINRRL